MTYVGDYDPTGFDQNIPGTWPTPAPYEPGQWWYLTAPGTVDGVAVDVGDRVYPIGTGRLYGEHDFGDGVFGGAVPDPPWPADPARVRWSARRWSSAPAWDRPPGPYDGAPFGDTGWRIAVEVFVPTDGARLYGDGSFGDDVFGDTMGPAFDWSDTACDVAGITTRRGGDDGAPFIDVDELSATVVDVTGTLVAIETSGPAGSVSRRAGVFTPLRVSLIDPDGDPWPLFTGRIESLVDRADRPPRLVEVQAFGMAADLVQTAPRFARPAETAGARLRALVRSCGYQWGMSGPPTGSTLRRIPSAENVEMRSLIDRTALSARWQMHTRPTGVIEWVEWPTAATGQPVIEVGDRLDQGPLPMVAADIIADTGELLNRATVESDDVDELTAAAATVDDLVSQSRWGVRSEAFGFPITGLSATAADLETLAAAAVARYGRVIARCSAIEVDTRQDSRWLAVLADLDVGRRVVVNVTKPTAATFDAVVAGVELSILPGRVAARIALSAITPTVT